MSFVVKSRFTQQIIPNPHQVHAYGHYGTNLSYYEKQHSIIISSKYGNKRGLYEYQLNTSKWRLLERYDDYFNYQDEDDYLQFLDESNDLLYVVRWNYYYRNAEILKYDLNKHKIEVVPLDIVDTTFAMTVDSYIFIPQHNLLHIFTSLGIERMSSTAFDDLNLQKEKDYIIVDMQQIKIIYTGKSTCCLSTDVGSPFKSQVATLLYIHSQETIYNVGSYQWNSVSSLSCDDRKLDKEWEFICDLPYGHIRWDEPLHNVILFDDIIVLFQYCEGEIWCMDIMDTNMKHKWCKSLIELPSCFPDGYDWDNPYAIRDKEDFVHLIKLKTDQKIHFKAKIGCLISKEIRYAREKAYKPLIIGYLRKEGKYMINGYIPQSLKRLIFMYYLFH